MVLAGALAALIETPTQQFTQQRFKEVQLRAGPPDREPHCFPLNLQCRRWESNPHALAGNGF